MKPTYKFRWLRVHAGKFDGWKNPVGIQWGDTGYLHVLQQWWELEGLRTIDDKPQGEWRNVPVELDQ